MSDLEEWSRVIEEENDQEDEIVASVLKKKGLSIETVEAVKR